MKVKYVQHETENENGYNVEYYVEMAQGVWELHDPDTANESEVIGVAIWDRCEECGHSILIDCWGTVDADEGDANEDIESCNCDCH